MEKHQVYGSFRVGHIPPSTAVSRSTNDKDKAKFVSCVKNHLPITSIFVNFQCFKT